MHNIYTYIIFAVLALVLIVGIYKYWTSLDQIKENANEQIKKDIPTINQITEKKPTINQIKENANEQIKKDIPTINQIKEKKPTINQIKEKVIEAIKDIPNMVSNDIYEIVMGKDQDQNIKSRIDMYIMEIKINNKIINDINNSLTHTEVFNKFKKWVDDITLKINYIFKISPITNNDIQKIIDEKKGSIFKKLGVLLEIINFK